VICGTSIFVRCRGVICVGTSSITGIIFSIWSMSQRIMASIMRRSALINGLKSRLKPSSAWPGDDRSRSRVGPKNDVADVRPAAHGGHQRRLPIVDHQVGRAVFAIVVAAAQLANQNRGVLFGQQPGIDSGICTGTAWSKDCALVRQLGLSSVTTRSEKNTWPPHC